MKLKKLYSSREVAVLTGLTSRQLQWWDARRLFTPAVASHRTEAGGFTERRYTVHDVLELQVLADLHRRGFSVTRMRKLLATTREVFGVRLFEAIGEGGPLTLLIAGNELFVRTAEGRIYNVDRPAQALLMDGDGLGLRVLTPRERRPRTPALRRTSGSETPSRGRRRVGESRGRR